MPAVEPYKTLNIRASHRDREQIVSSDEEGKTDLEGFLPTAIVVLRESAMP
jgi:hypothetical protein